MPLCTRSTTVKAHPCVSLSGMRAGSDESGKQRQRDPRGWPAMIERWRPKEAFRCDRMA